MTVWLILVVVILVGVSLASKNGNDRQVGGRTTNRGRQSNQDMSSYGAFTSWDDNDGARSTFDDGGGSGWGDHADRDMSCDSNDDHDMSCDSNDDYDSGNSD